MQDQWGLLPPFSGSGILFWLIAGLIAVVAPELWK